MKEADPKNVSAREPLYHMKDNDPLGQAIYDALWQLYKRGGIVPAEVIKKTIKKVIDDWNN